jgi:predicted nuclease of restriction endonuclease-like (RecB) superfamily
MRANGKVTKKRGEGVSDGAYLEWIADLKRRYRRTQIKAAVAVNSAMLEFYWSLGKDISGKYPGKKRNLGFFDNLSSDLCLGIKNPVGLSASNLRYAYRFFELYSLVPRVVEDNVGGSYLQQLAEDNASADYLQQVVADNWVADLMKIPWGHHIVIIGKSKGNRDKALFYVRKTIENGWSRADLQVAIGDRLYEKTGKALTNFSGTLPAPDGYLAKELIKNEYSFALTETVDENNEREVEKALVRNITRTLTELGGGFAYVGHQVRVNVGGEDFWPDLIFYHLKSRRYLVIELKAVNFKPEHIGQLGFYMVAVDRQLKNEWDAPTVGLVLCRDGNRTVVEYALSVTDKPMGVAKYRLTQKTPKELSSMKRAVAKLGTVVDETIADAERQIAEAKKGNGK